MATLQSLASADRPSSSRSFLPAGCGNDRHNDKPRRQQPYAGADAEGVQHGEQEHQKQRTALDAGEVRIAAGHGRPPNHHDGDRGQKIFVANVDVGPAEIAGEQRSVKPAQRAA